MKGTDFLSDEGMSEERLAELRETVSTARLLPWISRGFEECLDEISRLRARVEELERQGVDDIDSKLDSFLMRIAALEAQIASRKISCAEHGQVTPTCLRCHEEVMEDVQARAAERDRLREALRNGKRRKVYLHNPRCGRECCDRHVGTKIVFSESQIDKALRELGEGTGSRDAV